MDNLTHSLVGLAAAKAGLERLSPGATVVCVLAANAPDSDILAVFGGRWFYLENHRGITHSIIGTLTLALLIPLLFYLGDWLYARWRKRGRLVRFKGLLLASVVMSLSHPLLDWTNNYGVRPLLPWDGRWFYGDLTFIVDPWIWLVVGGAAFLLTAKTRWQTLMWATLALCVSLLVMSSRLESTHLAYPNAFRVIWFGALACLMLAHRKDLATRWGSRLAIAALAFVVVYWGALALLHHSALNRAQVAANYFAAPRRESVLRIAAMPTLANPLQWRCLAETDRATYLFDLTLGQPETVTAETVPLRYEKPVNGEAAIVAQASQDTRAVVLLNFSRFPVTRVEGDCLSQAIVQFADLRYTEPASGRRSGGFAAVGIPVSCPPETGEAGKR
ncbi:MAG TPA: metal-dependent hydrolase [Pyrinomonadaceae bacterium]